MGASNAAAAKAAGLRYVTDADPGISRIPHGKQFIYRDSKGRAVRDPRTLDRIRAIVIPPAWTDVWICPHADGHVQATGRDARGRKQYRYHAKWSAERGAEKYEHMIEFALALPAIRRRVEADLRKKPLTRDYVLATIIRLLEKTLIRIGNEEYARANKSFGLTTLRDEHVQFKGGTVVFHFRAKSGVMQTIELNDLRLARTVKECRDIPGPALFQYFDDQGRRQCIDSADVNAYLKAITGKPFTAKSFRTWAGTVLVAQALCDAPAASSEAAFKRAVVKAVDEARAKLGNTRAVCRGSYVHPAVLAAYRSGTTLTTVARKAPHGKYFSREEAATLALLRRERQHAAAA